MFIDRHLTPEPNIPYPVLTQHDVEPEVAPVVHNQDDTPDYHPPPPPIESPTGPHDTRVGEIIE
jgi:hypothetical protein